MNTLQAPPNSEKFARALIAIAASILHNRIMLHRHLNHSNYTLAAFDDIIARGSRADWVALRDACRSDEQVRAKIVRICEVYSKDRFAQRQALWALYAEQHAA
jgi:hypothetical protein